MILKEYKHIETGETPDIEQIAGSQVLDSRGFAKAQVLKITCSGKTTYMISEDFAKEYILVETDTEEFSKAEEVKSEDQKEESADSNNSVKE